MTLGGRFLVLARRPIFTAEKSVVKGVVGQSLLYPYVARDLLLRGKTSFKFLVGDSSLLYFVVDATKAKVSFEPPLNIYSEWESVPLVLKHLPLSLMLTVFILYSGQLPSFLKKKSKKSAPPTSM